MCYELCTDVKSMHHASLKRGPQRDEDLVSSAESSCSENEHSASSAEQGDGWQSNGGRVRILWLKPARVRTSNCPIDAGPLSAWQGPSRASEEAEAAVADITAEIFAARFDNMFSADASGPVAIGAPLLARVLTKQHVQLASKVVMDMPERSRCS